MISINRDTTSMVLIHVCTAGVAPCDDSEDQLVLSIGVKVCYLGELDFSYDLTDVEGFFRRGVIRSISHVIVMSVH